MTPPEPTRPIRTFRDLLVWQKAVQLALEVYRVTREFPREEKYGLTSQVRRAAELGFTSHEATHTAVALAGEIHRMAASLADKLASR